MKYLKLYEEFYRSYPNKKAELIDGEGYDESKDEFCWKIYRTDKGQYILTLLGFPENYKTEIKNMKNHFERESKYNYPESYLINMLTDIRHLAKISTKYKALKRLIDRMSSYKFQKQYLTKHPDRIKELEVFGYNKRILQEFKHLFVGKEWGFFDLKN